MDAPPSTSATERFSRGEVVLDTYEVEGILGEGGTGVVYAAKDRATGAEVALKVMHPHLASEAQVRGRFAREAAILRKLEGPHVCRILASGECKNPGGGEDLLCLALPRIHGRTLDRILEEEGPLGEERASRLVREVLDGLESAHGLGIIHRDLKPHNVIVDDDDRALVVDFGLSKILNGGGTGTTNLTALNMVFGTPEYMSPEQARGDDLDARCDLYAVGVMLFQLLTGELPFQGKSPLAVLTAHLTADIPDVASRAKPGDVSPAVASIVRRALAKDPNDRYPSAGAMRSALERAGVFPDEPDTTAQSSPAASSAPAVHEEPSSEAAPASPSETAPTTQRTPELARSSAPPRTSPSKPEVEIVPTSAERGLTPKPPSSRRLTDSSARSDTGSRSRNDTGSRSRASGPPTSRKSSPPKRDLRWVFAWVVLVGLGIAVGVVLGLR